MQKKHQVNGTKGPVIVCAGIYGRYRLHFFVVVELLLDIPIFNGIFDVVVVISYIDARY